MDLARSAAAVAGALALGVLVSGTARSLELTTTTTTEVTLPTTTTTTETTETTETTTTTETTETTTTTEAPADETTTTTEAPPEAAVTEALEEGLSIEVEATAEAPDPVHVGEGEVALELGAVRVTAPPVAPLSPGRSWVATVSLAAPGFTNGSFVLPPSNVGYVSGPATPESSGVAVRVPGDMAGGPRTLDAPRTAFSASGITPAGAVVVWEPRLEIDVPPDAEPGDYEGTITHSVL